MVNVCDIPASCYVETLANGLFRPVRSFEPGCLDCQVEPVEDERGDVLDAVAWAASDPARWWLRHGKAVVLGAPEIARSYDCEAAIALVTTPADWIERHARGRHWVACVLDWDGDLAGALSPAWKIVPETPELHRRVVTALRSRWARPAWLGRAA